MSEVETNVPPVAGTPAPVATPAPAPAAPAQPKSAIEIIEADIVNFFQQRERAIAQVHAVDGAIQATQSLLAKLKAEAAKAEAEGKKLLGEAKAEVSTLVADVEAEAKKL